MTEIRFYHLAHTNLEQALPELLEKVLQKNGRAVVMASSNERVETLNRLLWTYKDHSFLPHGSRADGHAPDQPVWLTDADENPNGAKFLFLTDGARSEKLKDFDMVCEIFEEAHEGAVEAARARWSEYKNSGFSLTYWQQGAKGRRRGE